MTLLLSNRTDEPWVRLGLPGIVGFFILLTSVSLNAGTFIADKKTGILTLKNNVVASQFLTRATFGPNIDEIKSLANHMSEIGRLQAMEEWIDSQFEITPTYHHSLALQLISEDGFTPNQTGISATRYRIHSWWEASITAPDQLRQRMAWALAQIFVVNERGAGFGRLANDKSGAPQYLGLLDYYDDLIRNSFGNYRTLLSDVTLHPIMGVFLSHLKNPKGNPSIGQFPDENYAREVLQLFSTGLYQLRKNGVYQKDRNGNLIPTYNNDTIKSFARVFTGLSYGGHKKFNSGGRNYHDPMDMFEKYHDVDEKVLLNSVVLPAGQTGLDDINDALDNISNHQNVPMFIGRLLIQRFVKSNPSKGYIRRVGDAFRDNGQGVRGDLKTVIKAVLLDKEAQKSLRYKKLRNPARLDVQQRNTEWSKLREPVLRYSALLRAFHPISTHVTGRMMIPALSNQLNQAPYQSPSVFNFYLPNHLPSGELQDYVPSSKLPNGEIYAPEFQIFTSVMNNRFANRIRSDVIDSKVDLKPHKSVSPIDIILDFSYEQSLASDIISLLGHLDLLLCSGTFSQTSKLNLAKIIEQETDDPITRVRGSIIVMLNSPECAVHE
ncbi:MAG: DUF1800 domain-containing protein [Gammaproteobacteria bacterium]